MKELFLLREQARVSGAFYDFESSNYGPSSNDVMQDLGAMIQRGLVQVGEGFGGSYSLTQKGFDEGARVWTSLPDDARRKIIGIKERYNFMPLSELLFHVYQGFPRYTDKSLIKDQVLAEFDQAGGAVKE